MRAGRLTIIVASIAGLTFNTVPSHAQNRSGNSYSQNDRSNSGPKGDEGDRGDNGHEGDQGPKGDPGPPGLVGPPGPAGPQGPAGPEGPAGPQGPAGPTGAQGPQGEKGETGATGPQGLQGEQGAKGDTGGIGPLGATGETGATGPQGPKGETGATGATGATGETGGQGPAGPQGIRGVPGPAGSFTPPNASQAVFGTGPITHFSGSHYVLESTSADTIRLRSTAGVVFLDFGLVYPASCIGNGSGATGMMVSGHRFSTVAGETLTGTLCTEGSTMLVTVYELGAATTNQFRCIRFAGNANVCQRIF